MAVASANPHISRQMIEESIGLVFEMMAFYLGHHQRVELRGFGIFSVRKRNSHKAHNPQTGERLWIPAKSVPFFRPSNALKEALKMAAKPAKKNPFLSNLSKLFREMV